MLAKITPALQAIVIEDTTTPCSLFNANSVRLVLEFWTSGIIHFWAKRNTSFGNKSCKICHMTHFVFHFPATWLVTLNKPWNLIGCFVFGVASSSAGKKMRFKTKSKCSVSKLVNSQKTYMIFLIMFSVFWFREFCGWVSYLEYQQ